MSSAEGTREAAAPAGAQAIPTGAQATPTGAPATPAGDVGALWEASASRVRAWFLRRTGNAHDADDLVQETFLRVHEKLSSVRDDLRLGAWVGVIAGNVLADHGRRAGRRAATTLEGEVVESAGGPARPGSSGRPGTAGLPEASCDDGGEDPELRRAVAGWAEAFLARLRPEEALLLRAVDLEGRHQAEVARELGLPASSVRSRVQRARARLREELEACCSFVFDARGNVTDAARRRDVRCACDEGQAGSCS